MSSWMRLLLMPVAMGVIVGALVLGLQFKREATTQSYVSVVVTTKDIAVGTKITSEMITTKQMPTEFAGTHESVAKDVLGKLAGGDIKSGEVVYPSRLIESKDAPLSYSLADGMRAITIKVDEITAVAFNAEPGDHVDILLTLSGKTLPDKTEAPSQSEVLLANIPVLSKGIGRPSTNLLGKPSQETKVASLTLGVTPEQALKLSLAEDMGRVQLILRPATDKQTAVPATIDEHSIRVR